ncbi:MAG: type II toxin-antitoxin system HicA family toxin [Vicinamibacterales bacterium]
MPNVRDVIRRLEREGWSVVRIRGDHRQFKHPDKPGRRVTIAGHPNSDLPAGTWNSVRRQAGWDEESKD